MTSQLVLHALDVLGARGCMTRVELRKALHDVHRNTWARHEKRAIEAGWIERVGAYRLRCTSHLPAAPRASKAPAVAPDAPPALAPESNAPNAPTVDELKRALNDARALVHALESLLQRMPNAMPDAPPVAPNAPQVAPKAPAIAPKAPPSAPNVVHSSRARAVSSACLSLPALRQAGQARACAHEPPPIDSEPTMKMLSTKMKRFRGIWRNAWKERFGYVSAPPLHALRHAPTFTKYQLEELDADEFQRRLMNFFDDDKAASKNWPVGWFLAGLHNDYAELHGDCTSDANDDDDDDDASNVVAFPKEPKPRALVRRVTPPPRRKSVPLPASVAATLDTIAW